jgi:hypothetical protein
MSDGQDFISPITAAMMYLSMGGMNSNAIDNYEGGFKMGYFKKNADSTTTNIKSHQSIISDDDLKNNKELKALIQRTHELLPIKLDLVGNTTTVWKMYEENDFDALKTAEQLLALHKFNPNLDKAFVDIFVHPSTVKTDQITPTHNVADVVSGKPIYLSQIDTQMYHNLAKLHADVNQDVTNNAQALGAQLMSATNQQGTATNPSFAKRLNSTAINYMISESENNQKKINKIGAIPFVRNMAINGMEPGTLRDMLASGYSPSISAPFKQILTMVKSVYKNAVNPKIEGDRSVMKSSSYIKVYTEIGTGKQYTEYQYEKLAKKYPAKFNLNNFKSGLGFQGLQWLNPDGSIVLSDHEIMSMPLNEVVNRLRIAVDEATNNGKKLKFVPGNAAYAFDFWKEMGFDNIEGSELNYRNFDVADINEIPETNDQGFVNHREYMDLGETKEERLEKLKSIPLEVLLNTPAGKILMGKKETYDKQIDQNKITSENQNQPYTPEQESIDRAILFVNDYYVWMERFNRNLLRIITRTPFQTTAMGVPVRISHFTNNSGNSMALPPAFQWSANADYDGDENSVFRKFDDADDHDTQYANSRFDLSMEYYTNPENAAIYLKPITTDTTARLVSEIWDTIRKIDAISGDKTRLRGVYDMISQILAFDNNHYRDRLIGMIANVMKVYSVVYHNSYNKANPSEPDFPTWTFPVVKTVNGKPVIETRTIINKKGKEVKVSNLVYEMKSFNSFKGNTGDMMDNNGENILMNIADFMQAILDHSKTMKIHQLRMNEATMNAQAAMLLAGIDGLTVAELFTKPETDEILKVLYKTADATAKGKREAWEVLGDLKVLHEAVKVQFDKLKASLDSEKDITVAIQKWNSLRAKIKYNVGLDYPIVRSDSNKTSGYDEAITAKIEAYDNNFEKLLPVFYRGKQMDRVTSVMKLTTKFLEREYDELDFFQTDMVALENPDSLRTRYDDNDKAVLSFGNYVPQIENELPTGEKVNVLYGVNSGKEFDKMNEVAKTFIPGSSIISGEHYIGKKGIMKVIGEYYKPLAEHVVIFRNPHFMRAVNKAMTNFGFKTIPSNDIWNAVMDGWELASISDWLQGNPLKDMDWSIDSFLANQTMNPNYMETKEERLKFMEDFTDMIENLIHNPEKLNLSDDTKALLASNKFLNAVDVEEDSFGTRRLRLRETIDTGNPNVVADIQDSVFQLNSILQTTQDSVSMIDMLWLYQMMVDRFNIRQTNIIKALPVKHSIIPLQSYSQYVDTELRILNNPRVSSEQKAAEEKKIEAAVMNIILQNVTDYIYSVNGILSKANKLDVASAFTKPYGLKNTGYPSKDLRSLFILDYDYNAYNENKDKSIPDYYFDKKEIIPMNEEAVIKNLGEEYAKKLFKYRKSIPESELPQVIYYNKRKGRENTPWIMVYDFEDKKYYRRWLMFSKTNPSFMVTTDWKNIFTPMTTDKKGNKVGIPSVKPSRGNIYEFEKGSVTIDFPSRISYPSEVIIDGTHAQAQFIDATTYRFLNNGNVTEREPLMSEEINTPMKNLAAELLKEYHEIRKAYTKEDPELAARYTEKVRELFSDDETRQQPSIMKDEAAAAFISKKVFEMVLNGHKDTEEIKSTIMNLLTCAI